MSVQRNATKTKPVPTPKKTFTSSASPLKSPTSGIQTNLKGLILEKTEKSLKTEPSSSLQTRPKPKEVPKPAVDGALKVNTVSDFNESELSIIKLLEGDINHDLLEDYAESKLMEEVTFLKKDLEMKNHLVDKLVKENNSLRKELDEVLATVEANKDKINTKVSGCNQRILELENEIKTLKSQNLSYKEQLFKKDKEMAGETGVKDLEDYVNKYYSDAKKGMDEFYRKLNQKIAGFVDTPKSQGHNETPVTNNVNNSSDDSKKEATKKPYFRAQTQIPEQSQTTTQNNIRGVTRHATLRTGSSISQPKGKFNINNVYGTPNNASSTTTATKNNGRIGAMSASNRRKKMITLYNFDDIMPIDKSEGNFGILKTNESVGKSPKNSITIQNNLAKELPKYEF